MGALEYDSARRFRISNQKKKTKTEGEGEKDGKRRGTRKRKTEGRNLTGQSEEFR